MTLKVNLEKLIELERKLPVSSEDSEVSNYIKLFISEEGRYFYSAIATALKDGYVVNLCNATSLSDRFIIDLEEFVQICDYISNITIEQNGRNYLLKKRTKEKDPITFEYDEAGRGTLPVIEKVYHLLFPVLKKKKKSVEDLSNKLDWLVQTSGKVTINFPQDCFKVYRRKEDRSRILELHRLLKGMTGSSIDVNLSINQRFIELSYNDSDSKLKSIDVNFKPISQLGIYPGCTATLRELFSPQKIYRVRHHTFRENLVSKLDMNKEQELTDVYKTLFGSPKYALIVAQELISFMHHFRMNIDYFYSKNRKQLSILKSKCDSIQEFAGKFYNYVAKSIVHTFSRVYPSTSVRRSGRMMEYSIEGCLPLVLSTGLNKSPNRSSWREVKQKLCEKFGVQPYVVYMYPENKLKGNNFNFGYRKRSIFIQFPWKKDDLKQKISCFYRK